MIRTLIVDDEPFARSAVRVRLDNELDIEIVGEAEDGLSAVEMIEASLPELVFLDVQMPEMDGFAVVEAVAERHMPVVVFVTAFDEYAVNAFEHAALDYLLKPFTDDRFKQVLTRVRREFERDEAVALRDSTLDVALRGRGQPQDDYAPRFAVRVGDKYRFVSVESIEWIEAARNNVMLYTADAHYSLRSTMTAMEARLDPAMFVRIHRSTIVNVACIEEVQPEWHGDFDVDLKSGKRLRMSRIYRKNLIP